jgi:hypothetical protein
MTSMLRLLTTLVCAAASLVAADRISLNGEWQFRTDQDGKGAAQGWSSRVPQGVCIDTRWLQRRKAATRVPGDGACRLRPRGRLARSGNPRVE